MNVASEEKSMSCFDSTASIFNLSAPGAVKLEDPTALSYNELSLSALAIVSVIDKPILYVGKLEY
jgi:hypothetical protein